MMSQKMSFVLGLWLLCGFLANLPTALSIQCYACADYPGSPEPCNNSAVITCESYFDSCMSVTTTVEFYGMNHTTTAKNCSLSHSEYSCNQTFICDKVNSSVAAAGGSVIQCDLRCCHSDRCNGQGGGGGGPQPPTPGPDSQSRLKYYIETIRALLDQMEHIVENDLSSHVSAREYKGTDLKINDFIIGQLKSKAVELAKKLETKQGRSKRRAAKSLREKKRGAKSLQLLGEAMETIQKGLARMVPKKR
ncbi:uncharacterized protein LOC144638284 isoform X1 [Oculina patagonica]